jgi:hypothetical protein
VNCPQCGVSLGARETGAQCYSCGAPPANAVFAEAIALLREVEWSGGDGGCCPVCDGLEPNPGLQWEGADPIPDIGHRPECRLAALLATTRTAPSTTLPTRRVLHVQCSKCFSRLPLADWDAHAARCGISHIRR